ncbi:hypothetical protein Zm00014a_014805 [Zea mays]|uniref:Uncharacterized protein n=1 Tax=Zea mays TaxID=4577 RepID=A0A3L6EJS7_MAIZE|nr:hypothetical protein Zm00014a_014805 [Zea mays]
MNQPVLEKTSSFAPKQFIKQKPKRESCLPLFTRRILGLFGSWLTMPHFA